MRLLVVEDEARLAGLLRKGLGEEGYAVDTTGDGEEALEWVEVAPYDAIILDVMLPGMDGLAVCRHLRRRRVRTPILLLTARDAVHDRVAGLDAGADDYLIKPFHFAELSARLRALARRPADTQETILRAGDVSLDPATRRVWRGEREVILQNKEFRILDYLMRNPDRVLTRGMIADHVWDYDFPNVTNVIDVHIRALRTKLEDPYPGGLIQTVRGAGYRFGGGTGGGGAAGAEERTGTGRTERDRAAVFLTPRAEDSESPPPRDRLLLRPLRPLLPLIPIRWRLTFWYAALLTGIVVLLGTGLYLGLQHRLYASFDEQLRNQAAVTLAAVQMREGVPSLAAAQTQGQDFDYFVRLLGADGEPILDTGFDGVPVPLDRGPVSTALTGSRRFDTVTAEDETLRVLTVPVRDGDRVVGALQVGLDREDLDEILGELLGALALAVPVAVVAAAGVGYLVAGRALAPVSAITSLAGRIGGQDLSARLALALPNDELGRLASTFDAMLERIEDAFERQRRFTGDAAHELRTPLSLMRSQVDVTLARRRTPEEYEEALHDLGGDLERLTGLVGTLLTLARADSGQLVPDYAPFALDEVVRFVVDQYRPLATEAGVELRDEAAPTPVEADQDRIVQVLVNLVANALAHTPPGGEIAVGCRLESDRALLQVADTGSGIAPQHQARVFDRFYRIDAGRTRAQGGTGLGLAICKAITEAHDGTIELVSAPGRGTTVSLRLPCRPSRSRAARDVRHSGGAALRRGPSG